MQWNRSAGLAALCLFVVVCGGTRAEALDLYFLRHAQTVANVTRDYSEENQRTFSPLGEAQIAEVLDKLAPYEFDVVIASPAYRVLHTILPYLQARDIQAEIWPELYECCWDRSVDEEDPELRIGARIEIEEALQPWFRFRDDESVFMLDVDTPARGELMVQRAEELMESRFGGTEMRVLIVSHHHTGSRLLTALVSEPPSRRISPVNARLTHLRQGADGRFRLLMLNDEILLQGE